MSGRPIPGGYETWSKEDELRAQLAAVTAERDALAAELATVRAQLGAVDEYGSWCVRNDARMTFVEWLTAGQPE